MMQAAKNGNVPDFARIGVFRRSIGNTLQSLMRSEVVVVLDIRGNQITELSVGKDDKMIETFLSEGSDKAFCKGIGIGGMRNGGDMVEEVFMIGEILEFP